MVLQEFAERLSGRVLSTDTVARLADDEFVIILESLKLRGCGPGRRQDRRHMDMPLQIFKEQRVVSTSLGIAVRHIGKTDGEALLARAVPLSTGWRRRAGVTSSLKHHSKPCDRNACFRDGRELDRLAMSVQRSSPVLHNHSIRPVSTALCYNSQATVC